MKTTTDFNMIPSLPEGRRLAALYFEEKRFGLREHVVRPAIAGDHGLIVHTGDGYAFVASEAIRQNALLITPIDSQVDIGPGIYAAVTAKGLSSFDLAIATPTQRDRIEEAVATYHALQRPDSVPCFEGNDLHDIEESLAEPALPQTVSVAVLTSEDLEAIANFMDDDAGTMPQSAEVSPRIAVALSSDQVLHLLHLNFSAESCSAKIESIQQGSEMVAVLDQRVVLDFSPSQQQFIGLLLQDDKVLLDAALSQVKLS